MVSEGLIIVGTGNDDLREGGRLILHIRMRDREVFTQGLINRRRLPDRSEARFSWSLGTDPAVEIEDIERVEVEFIPDRREWMWDDQWEMTQLVFLVNDDSAGSRELFRSNRRIKFEREGIFSSGLLPSYRLTPDTLIKVIDDSGNPVPSSLVIVDSLVAGRTDREGELVASMPIAESARLLARTRIHEQDYYRSHHNVDSSQNWNYRVYQTNLRITAEGLAVPDVTREEGIISLRVSPQNILIGLNLLLTVEWDATADDLRRLQQIIRSCSMYLYNATDGQFFIERAQIFDVGQLWDDSDYRCFADLGYRANVPNITGGFLGWNVLGSAMKMSRGNDAPVYAHEFGHFGLDLRDEYQDGNPGVSCSMNLNIASSLFTLGAPQASCVMWNQWSASKLCSGHPSNPHVRGTRQGDQACWDKLTGRYNRDGGWRILTPTDRDGIPSTILFADGTISSPLIQTTISSGSGLSNFPDLIGTISLLVTDRMGSPMAGLLVKTHDARAWLVQGTTDPFGGLQLAGIHIDDTLRLELGPLAFEMNISGPGPLVVMV